MQVRQLLETQLPQMQEAILGIQKVCVMQYFTLFSLFNGTFQSVYLS